MKSNYSVLMSVYIKENPQFLREALTSVFSQNVLTNDLVLVCDGPLTTQLEEVIEEFKLANTSVMNVIKLEKNMGLGAALNEGLKFCKNELVARMDTDDICLSDRFEKQLKHFESNTDIAISSGKIIEFIDDSENITGSRVVPLTHNEIVTFSKKRNPFNHPAVMFKKSVVESVGGYDERFHLFEDYYLWVRILKNNFKSSNLKDTLVLMRTPSDLYLRRGGMAYAKDLLRFNNWMKEIGWISPLDYFLGAIPHAVVCILPNKIRKIIYQKLHS